MILRSGSEEALGERHRWCVEQPEGSGDLQSGFAAVLCLFEGDCARLMTGDRCRAGLTFASDLTVNGSYGRKASSQRAVGVLRSYSALVRVKLRA